jgi:3-hydroxybutyryl-CoA dehydrogenase
MGAGIAQVAAQAGHPVKLLDLREGAAAAARRKLAATLESLAAKGKLASDVARAAAKRVEPVSSLEAGRDAALVIETIVEDLDAKRSLLRQIEGVVDSDCIMASNTSSISITALGNGLRFPERLIGMHFFNPVPLMKLVEVVSGLRTDIVIADQICNLAMNWGKAPVKTRSTPGFIVNRIARPYYAEALALLHERAAEPAVIDACLRGAGFRMGPCELMDLIGHDTNLAVTESVYKANFGDKRYAPSLVQRELVDGGMLGRKAGRGFYVYPEPATTPRAALSVSNGLPPEAQHLVLHGGGTAVEHWRTALAATGTRFELQPASDWTGLAADNAQLRLTDGRPASQVAAETRCADIAVFDLPFSTALGAPPTTLAWATSISSSERWRHHAPNWLRLAGWQPQIVADPAGLIVARTIAMLINEAADAVQQGVCTPEGADAAMRLGVNYPAGPFEWLAHWNAKAIVQLLDNLSQHYRGERYRASTYLKQRAWAAGVR